MLQVFPAVECIFPSASAISLSMPKKRTFLQLLNLFYGFAFCLFEYLLFTVVLYNFFIRSYEKFSIFTHYALKEREREEAKEMGTWAGLLFGERAAQLSNAF